MAKKIFTFRGKKLEELKALSMDELAPLLSTDFRRKLARGFTEQEKKFLAKVQVKNNVKTHCRDMFILPNMVAKTIKVQKGNGFEDIIIQPEMIGHRLGEFALSRKRVKHSSAGVATAKK